MCGPTRFKVVSTHSATSSKMRAMLGYGLQHQREADFHRIADPFGALPVALAYAEIKAVQLGAAVELRPAGILKLKINRHILGDPVQRQRTDRAEAGSRFGDALGYIVSRGLMRDVENIFAADRRVAILVHRIDRVQIDLHIDTRAFQRAGRELDRRGEFMEHTFELGTGLHAGEFEAALLRIGRVTWDGARCAGGGRRECERNRGRGNDESAHERFSDLVNGSMRLSTSSLFQK